MRSLILATAVAVGLLHACAARADDYDNDDDPHGFSQYTGESYTTVPFGNPYSGQQGTGWTTYDGSYRHSCSTMRFGLGYRTTCR